MIACGIEVADPTSPNTSVYMRACEDHFQPHDFEENDVHRKLIPTVDVHPRRKDIDFHKHLFSLLNQS